MSKFNYSVETVRKYHDYGWFVSKDIKPASCFYVESEESYTEAVDYITTVFPGLKVRSKNVNINPICIEIHVYKYDHINTIIDEMNKCFTETDALNTLYHVLSGYIYGIPAHMVEKFLNDLKG